MKLGLNLGYWGSALSATSSSSSSCEAERLGFDSVWTAEAYGSDAATSLAWLAARRRRSARLGDLPDPRPRAAMTAMTAATLDQLSGGRFLLGIGTSGPQVAEGWHGVRFGRQLTSGRASTSTWCGWRCGASASSYHGETLELPLPDGPGKALKLTIAPVQERIPIYLAAIGPKNTALAAEIADGWLPILVSPEHMRRVPAAAGGGLRARRAGTARGLRHRARPSTFCIDDDLDAARDVMRGYVALYVGGMGSRDKNFYNRLVRSYGFEDAARGGPGPVPGGQQGRGDGGAARPS